jgi:hypothetical protein
LAPLFRADGDGNNNSRRSHAPLLPVKAKPVKNKAACSKVRGCSTGGEYGLRTSDGTDVNPLKAKCARNPDGIPFTTSILLRIPNEDC